MTDVQITVTVPQAAQALGAALVQLVSDVKAKGSLTADAVALVETAVANFSELKLEASDPNLPAYAGLLAGQLVGVLVAAPAPAAPAAQAAPAPAPAS
jgi:hypothetical protein